MFFLLISSSTLSFSNGLTVEVNQPTSTRLMSAPTLLFHIKPSFHRSLFLKQTSKIVWDAISEGVRTAGRTDGRTDRQADSQTDMIPAPGNRRCSSGLSSAAGSERSAAEGWCGSGPPGCCGPWPGCCGTGGWWRAGRADGPRRGRSGGCTGADSQTGRGPWADRSWGRPGRCWNGLDGRRKKEKTKK